MQLVIFINQNGPDFAGIDNISLTGSCGAIEDCTNGIDDDGDGLIDCDDPDCGGVGTCPEIQCSDGIDNDGDGLVDCLDSDCDSDVAYNPTNCIDGSI